MYVDDYPRRAFRAIISKTIAQNERITSKDMHILGFCTCIMLQTTAKNRPKLRYESFRMMGDKAPLIEPFSYQCDENCISGGRRQRI